MMKKPELQELYHQDSSGKAPNSSARVSLHYKSQTNIHKTYHSNHKFYLLPPKHFKSKVSILALITP